MDLVFPSTGTIHTASCDMQQLWDAGPVVLYVLHGFNWFALCGMWPEAVLVAAFLLVLRWANWLW